jgi:cytochrome c oxidase subunit I+III
MSERWGKVSFWLIVGGFNLGFFPMHLLGLQGMPRRIYTYGPEMGWGTLNLVATIGAAVAILGGVIFVANALLSLRFGRVAGADPWGGSTLEWAIPSPPEPHNFAHMPFVTSIAPMWDGEGTLAAMDGLAEDRREVLITSVVDAVPQYRQESASPSLWPLVAALAVSGLFVWSIFSPWALVWGAIPVGAALAAWFWPTRPRRTRGLLAVRQ